MRQISTQFILGLSLCLCGSLSLRPVSAHAWGDLGHSLVGAIAEANLTVQGKNFVRGILGVEPLATAAIWPDHVRDDERFGGEPKSGDSNLNLVDHDFAPYHFAEIPTGETYDSKPKVTKDAFGAITHGIEILKDKNSQFTREEKMIALRYLVHIAGDIHQPLHVGNGHDLGGNTCRVKWLKESRTSNFHSVWDDNMVTELGYSYKDLTPKHSPAKYLSDFLPAIKLSRPEMFTAAAKAEAYKGSVKDWLQESSALREVLGFYPDDEAAMKDVAPNEKYQHRNYCTWFTDQDKKTVGAGSPDFKTADANARVLDSDYAKKYSKLVESQLLKAGLRLAAIIDDIATQANNAPAAIDDDAQEKTISRVQKFFKN